MTRSPLQRAIARGLRPDGNMVEELRALEDSPIRSRKDAQAICEALRTLPCESSNSDTTTSPLHALTSLFQDVESRDAPAFAVLSDEGIAELVRIFDATMEHAKDDDSDDLLFVLKVLAMYGSQEGAERLIAAARRPLKPDAYMWHVIMAMVSEDHPHRDRVFEALSDPLPPGFIAVSLLDGANGAAIEGELDHHPFDCPAGWERIGQWLEDRNPEHASYAHSATAALPFLTNPPRDQLIALAMDHTEVDVQLEAAWAAGKLGREAGLRILARFCLDINHSDVAKRYLDELGREDLIPREAMEPGFEAKAEFARWLAHPNELGQPPDELEVVDHRTLQWPPEREPRPFWIIRYRLRDATGLTPDDVDCGVIGSITWCFFAYHMDQRPPADVYAIHCAWEMTHAELIDEMEVTNPSEYESMLDQWDDLPLEDPTITYVAEISPTLDYPGRLVALARSHWQGKPGWVVLDGPRSTWYPESDQPRDTHETVVLRIHIGRVLLGFGEQYRDRRRFLKAGEPAVPDAQVVGAYEKLMTEAAEAQSSKKQEMLSAWGPLASHFNNYVEALAATSERAKPELLVDVYHRFVTIAEGADPQSQDRIFRPVSLLGEHFAAYVDAMIAVGRTDEIPGLVEQFAPRWSNNAGHVRLGEAAFKAGYNDLAEHHLLAFRKQAAHFHRSETMDMLAELWHQRGEETAARDLLIECMSKLVGEIEKSKYRSDREQFTEEFQEHRAVFLRLFPDGESQLEELGLADDPQ